MRISEWDKNASQLSVDYTPKAQSCFRLPPEILEPQKPSVFLPQYVYTCQKKGGKMSTWRIAGFSAVHKASEDQSENVWSKYCMFLLHRKKKIPHPNNLKGFSHISCAPDTSASSSTCDGVPLDCSGYLVALLALCYSNKLRAQEWFSSTAPSSRSWPSRCNLSQGSLFFYLFSSICLIF